MRHATGPDFDARYLANPDPWGVDERPYEREKADRTLAAIPRHRMRRGLEMGCGTGSFTERLARRCGHLRAVDVSAESVRLTSARTRGLPRVQAECRDLRRDWPAGPWDLIVCAEVLYYWTPGEVLVWLGRAERSIAPGGALVCVHWTGDDPAAPMDGEAAHQLVRERTELTQAVRDTHDGYVLDRFDAR